MAFVRCRQELKYTAIFCIRICIHNNYLRIICIFLCVYVLQNVTIPKRMSPLVLFMSVFVCMCVLCARTEWVVDIFIDILIAMQFVYGFSESLFFFRVHIHLKIIVLFQEYLRCCKIYI